MKHLHIVALFVLLSACSQQNSVTHLEQRQQCWNIAKTEFSTENPNSPAFWYLQDAESTAQDFQNTSKATNIEIKHLRSLTDTERTCNTLVLQPTGDYRYDNMLRTAFYASSQDYEQLEQYMKKKITRGEYFQRHAAIKAGVDASIKQQIAPIQQEHDDMRRRLANGFAAAADNINAQHQRSEALGTIVIGSPSAIDSQYNSSVAQSNMQREIQDMEWRNSQALADQERKLKEAERAGAEQEWESDRLRTQVRRGY